MSHPRPAVAERVSAATVRVTSKPRTRALHHMRKLARALAALMAIGVIAAFSATDVHAQAQGLASVGPTDPGNGFPQFYQDKAGLALEPCLASQAAGDPCGIAADVPVPTSPIVFPTNFPDEFFYWQGTSRIRPLAGS